MQISKINVGAGMGSTDPFSSIAVVIDPQSGKPTGGGIDPQTGEKLRKGTLADPEAAIFTPENSYSSWESGYYSSWDKAYPRDDPYDSYDSISEIPVIEPAAGKPSKSGIDTANKRVEPSEIDHDSTDPDAPYFGSSKEYKQWDETYYDHWTNAYTGDNPPPVGFEAANDQNLTAPTSKVLEL